MDTEILVVGAGPAGLAVAATLNERGRRPLVIEKAAAGRRVLAQPLRAAAPAHGEGAVGAAGHAVSRPRRRATCRARASSTTSPPTPRAPGIAPRFGEEATAIVPRRRRAAGGRRRARRRDLPLATPSSSPPAPTTIRSCRRSTARRASPATDRAQPRLPQRRAVRGPARARRRHGQHRRRDRARPRRARRRGRALGALAGQHRLSRRPRPADAADVDPALRACRRALGDALARWLCDVTVGDLGRYGLPRSRVSPLRQLREQGRTPVIDVGTLARIKSGEIAVFPGHSPSRSPAAPSSSTAARAPFDADRPRHRLPRRRRGAVPGERGARRRQRPADASSIGTRRARRRLLRRLRHAPARRPAAHDRRAGGSSPAVAPSEIGASAAR